MFVRRPVRYSSIVHNRVFHHAFSKMQGSWYHLLTCWQNLSEKGGSSHTGIKEPVSSISYLVCWEDEPVAISLGASQFNAIGSSPVPSIPASCILTVEPTGAQHGPTSELVLLQSQLFPSFSFPPSSSPSYSLNLPMGALQWTLICHLALSQSPSHAG